MASPETAGSERERIWRPSIRSHRATYGDEAALFGERPMIAEILRLAPVIPVLVIDDAAQARPIGEALVRGGLRVLEVTLRTPAAIDVVKAMGRGDGAI